MGGRPARRRQRRLLCVPYKSITSTRAWRLEQFAYWNRRALTCSEARLWTAIKARQLGVQFRRQAVVGERFIVDFLAPPMRLVVEVDGGYHAGRVRADKRRDETLLRLGYRVLRIEADLVMRDLAGAVGAVRAALAERRRERGHS